MNGKSASCKIALMIMASAPAALAQPLEFETASVRLAKPPSDGRYRVGGRFDPAMFTGEYMTMKDYIQTAYPLRAGDTISGPDWISSREFVYNIVAKAAAPAPARDMRTMLQNLLAARFHLQLHTVDRTADVYALVQNGKGFKQNPVGFDGPDSTVRSIHPIPNGVEFQHAPMSMIAHALSGNTLGRVDDETGLTGLYDLKLTYATKAWEPLLDPPIDSPEPSIFTALQSVGLKLERRRGTVKAYIIDNVDRTPAEN